MVAQALYNFYLYFSAGIKKEDTGEKTEVRGVW